MAGETGVLVDTTITGAVNLLYCSYVTNYLRDLPSAIMLSWREIKDDCKGGMKTRLTRLHPSR